MDNQKNKWVTPKEIIGISELRTLSSYILDPRIKPLMPKSELKQIQEYAIFLETKLTPELVEKLFKGIKRGKSKDDLIEHRFWIKGKIGIDFYYSYSSNGEAITKIEVYTLKSNGWQTDKQEFIQTLADLARLTAAKPILLA